MRNRVVDDNRLFGTFRRFTTQKDCHISLFPTHFLAEKRSTLRVVFNSSYRVPSQASRVVVGLDWLVMESSSGMTKTDLMEQGLGKDGLVKTEIGGAWKVCLGPGSLQRVCLFSVISIL